MPATVKPRPPMKKALCIGVEYRQLSEQFPHLHLPAAHLDPTIMAGLLQGESYGESPGRLRLNRGGGVFHYF